MIICRILAAIAIVAMCLLCGCESFHTVEQQILSAAQAATAETNAPPEQP